MKATLPQKLFQQIKYQPKLFSSAAKAITTSGSASFHSDHMANNMMAYKYFVGFNFSNLEYQDQHEVRKGINEGYLRLETSTRIIREAYTVPHASSFKAAMQSRVGT